MNLVWTDLDAWSLVRVAAGLESTRESEKGGTLMSPRRPVRLSLSTQVLLGLVLGIGGGIIGGEDVAFLQHGPNPTLKP